MGISQFANRHLTLVNGQKIFVICLSVFDRSLITVFTIENQSVPNKRPKVAGIPTSKGLLKAGFTVL